MLPCFATTTPGLEALLLGELVALGLAGEITEAGGVAFDGDAAALARALLALRTAHRVTVRLAEFRARGFAELERHGATVEWERILAPGSAVHFRVSSRKSRLYHEDGIAERLEGAVLTRLGHVERVRGANAALDREADVLQLPGVQRFVVRLFRDRVTISADAAGALLHRRGWRRDVGKAPLRETLAAAMLLGVTWQGTEPLLDPMAGSGTIPIEAALLARRMAPGRLRRFAAEQWPLMEGGVFEAVRHELAASELPECPVPIAGRDRDAGAVRAAIANAERAGVAGDVDFTRGAVSDIPPDDGTGLVITNPPYGVRVSETRALRDLYAALGRTLRARRPGWRIALLSASPVLDGQVGASWREVWRTTNGGIPVRLLSTPPPSGARAAGSPRQTAP